MESKCHSNWWQQWRSAFLHFSPLPPTAEEGKIPLLRWVGGGSWLPPPHPPQKREKSLFCGGWEGEIAFAMAFGDGTKCTVSLTLKIPCFFTTSLRRFHNNKIAEKCGDLPNLPQQPPLPFCNGIGGWDQVYGQPDLRNTVFFYDFPYLGKVSQQQNSGKVWWFAKPPLTQDFKKWNLNAMIRHFKKVRKRLSQQNGI